ncbi:MAG TPA: zf-HC2 domain-containing protein [Anaeromyxobacteraceae bacterium]|nr:zf-HC2 domain-containing protein [Anaeromyxobacteraceae bacterium]
MTASCAAVRSCLAAHLDGESTPLDAEAIRGHLAGCDRCRSAAEELGAYRAAVARVFRPARAPGSLHRAVRRRVRAFGRPRPWVPAVAVAAVLASLALALLATREARSRIATLGETAVLHHDAIVTGQAPLDVTTSDPAGLVTWFAGRLPFSIHLPRLDSPELHLVGARLIEVAGDLAALVVYRKGGAMVTLAVAPAASGAPPRGSEAETFRSLRFHLSRTRGHNVIAWTDGGLAYALVSDLPSQGRASCLVCHARGSGLRDVEEFHR